MAGSTEHRADVHVGQRIRLARTLRGMSQTTLGEALGLTFQQFQKYESGANKVSAGRLFFIAQVLDVPVSFFFDGLSVEGEGGSSGADLDARILRPGLNTMRGLAEIENEGVRRALSALVQALAKPGRASGMR